MKDQAIRIKTIDNMELTGVITDVKLNDDEIIYSLKLDKDGKTIDISANEIYFIVNVGE